MQALHACHAVSAYMVRLMLDFLRVRNDGYTGGNYWSRDLNRITGPASNNYLYNI